MTRPPTGSPWRVLVLAGLLLGVLPSPLSARSRLHIELGPSYEFSNLVYRSTDVQFLGTVCDSLFADSVQQDSCLGAAVFNDSIVVASSPEAVRGVMARFSVSDTLASDRFYYIEPELQLADLLVTGHLNGTWRWGVGKGFLVGADQRFDHSLDHRFGFSRRLDTEAFTGELGYRSSDLGWSVDLRPGLQIDRSDDDGNAFSGYFQDSNGGRLGLGISHLSLSGTFLDLDGHYGSRSYPDSALRNYREIYGALRLAQPLPCHMHSNLGAEYERRSGDNEDRRNDLYNRWRGELEAGSQGEVWQARVRGSAERLDFRRPDEVFYDNRIYKLEVGVGPTVAGGLDLELKPRFQWLRAPGTPQEAYRQASLALAATRVGGGFVDLLLEAGRRQYTDPGTSLAPDSSVVISSHSDYHLYNASVILTRPFTSVLRLKASFDYSLEVHDRAEDNNHIVFLNAELSYGFWLAGR